jgi:Phage integrase, N-terminal SAM-like domain
MDRVALSPLLRSFERHLRAENRSEHTIASYLDSLCQAEAFLAGRGRTLVDARREDLEAFLGELLQRRAPETVATRYRRLRVLYHKIALLSARRLVAGRPGRPGPERGAGSSGASSRHWASVRSVGNRRGGRGAQAADIGVLVGSWRGRPMAGVACYGHVRHRP